MIAGRLASRQARNWAISRAGPGSPSRVVAVQVVRASRNWAASRAVVPSRKNASRTWPPAAVSAASSWAVSRAGSAAAASASSISLGWPCTTCSTRRTRSRSAATAASPARTGPASACSRPRRPGSSRASATDSARSRACTGSASTLSPSPAGGMRLVRITRDSPPWPVSAAISGSHRGSRQVPARGEQGFQVVQHQQNPGIFQQPPQPRGERGQRLDGGDLVRHREPELAQLDLQLRGQAGQRPAELIISERGLPERGGGERVLVPVGQLQRARGLARPGHPVQQHPRLPAARRQHGTGPRHGLGPADEPLRLGRERLHPHQRRVQVRLRRAAPPAPARPPAPPSSTGVASDSTGRAGVGSGPAARATARASAVPSGWPRLPGCASRTPSSRSYSSSANATAKSSATG